jgi:hypothetical protein
MPSEAFPTAAPLIGAASAVKPARPIAAPVRTVNKTFRIVVSSLAVGELPTLDVVRWTDPVGPPRISAMKDATSPPSQQPPTDLPLRDDVREWEAPNAATSLLPEGPG